MLSAYLFLLLILFFWLSPTLGSNRIFNGRNVTISEFPYQAHIFSMNNLPQCGAVIISKTFVLTAAHCIQPSFSHVLVKSSFLRGAGEMIGVKRRIQHPNFRKDPSNKYDFDFGLMELERDILFDEFAQPIRMIHLGDLLPLPKTLIDVTGFGLYSNEHHRPSSVLRHISIPLNEFESCRQLYPRLSNNMFCAGWGTKMDSAKGDSGGPAALRQSDGSRKLLGITSFGNDVYGLGYPGFYGFVPAVVDWIRNETGDFSL